jgi:hypothetical protein
VRQACEGLPAPANQGEDLFKTVYSPLSSELMSVKHCLIKNRERVESQLNEYFPTALEVALNHFSRNCNVWIATNSPENF